MDHRYSIWSNKFHLPCIQIKRIFLVYHNTLKHSHHHDPPLKKTKNKNIKEKNLLNLMQIKPEKRVCLFVLIQTQGLLPSESMFSVSLYSGQGLFTREKKTKQNQKTKESSGKCHTPITLSITRYDVMSSVCFPKFIVRGNKTQKSKNDFFCCENIWESLCLS